MSNNTFDMVRKIRHLPGLKLAAFIEPKHITKRVKNAAQKMLRTGILTSSYRSQSRMLAEQLLDSVSAAYAASANSWAVGIYIPSQLTEDVRAQIVEVIEASRMIELAGMDGRDPKYANERYEGMLSAHRGPTRLAYSIRLYNAALHVRVGELVSACRTPEQVKVHEALAAKLDSTDIIPVNF